MDFTQPLSTGFTVYSKSGCIMCSKVKNLLKEKSIFFQVIDCDDYLIEDKEGFLSFMESCVGSSKPQRSFPIVFYDAKFIGGFQETNEFVQKLLLQFEEMF